MHDEDNTKLREVTQEIFLSQLPNLPFLKLILFECSESDSWCEAVAKHIDLSIGFKGMLDGAVARFATNFYNFLGRQEWSVGTSFMQAQISNMNDDKIQGAVRLSARSGVSTTDYFLKQFREQRD